FLMTDYNKPQHITEPTTFMTLEQAEKALEADYKNNPITPAELNSAGNFQSSNASGYGTTNDTKRASDVNAILNAISQYRADHKGQLPLGITSSPTVISTTGANICSLLVPQYLPVLPEDPLMHSTGTDCKTAYSTEYVVSVSTEGKVTVGAVRADSGYPASVSR